jgi:NitT/TauT family transport system ATP-binding protein
MSLFKNITGKSAPSAVKDEVTTNGPLLFTPSEGSAISGTGSLYVQTPSNRDTFEYEDVDVINVEKINQSFPTSNGVFTLFKDFSLDIKDFKNVGQFISIMGQSGCGKCVCGDTYVKTNIGINKIKNLVNSRIADTTIENNTCLKLNINNNIESLSHFYYGGTKQTKLITLDNGDTLEGTLVHPVKVWRNFNEEWIPMKSLQIGDVLLKDDLIDSKFETIDNTIEIPCNIPWFDRINKIKQLKKEGYTYKQISETLQVSSSIINASINNKYKKSNFTAPKYLTTDLAYYLGLLSGDGTITNKNIGITTCDKEIKEFVINFHKTVLNVDSSTFNKNGTCAQTIMPLETHHFKKWLEIIGFHFGDATTKTVPDVILNAPWEYQLYYTKGLFDTDGSIDIKNNRAEISLNSKDLINFIKMVLSCCGISYKCKKRNKSFRLWTHKHININNLFTLPRKQNINNINNLIDYQSNQNIIYGSYKYLYNIISTNNLISKMSASVKQFLKRKNDAKRYLYDDIRLELQQLGVNIKLLPNYSQHQIINIEDSNCEVFDLCNPDSHSFIANGYLVHNSQLLRCISGLNHPDSGIIKIYGKEKTNKDILPMVFQQYSSFPWMTVLENVTLPLKWTGMGKKEREEKAREMLKIVGLEGQENKWAQYPILSGGQLQRVAICRCLISNPQILLLDEICSGLDVISRKNMQNFLLEIFNNPKIDLTFLNVTHSPEEAVYLSNRVYILTANPCTIHSVIDINFDCPRNEDLRKTQKFTEYVNQIDTIMNQINQK